MARRWVFSVSLECSGCPICSQLSGSAVVAEKRPPLPHEGCSCEWAAEPALVEAALTEQGCPELEPHRDTWVSRAEADVQDWADYWLQTANRLSTYTRWLGVEKVERRRDKLIVELTKFIDEVIQLCHLSEPPASPTYWSKEQIKTEIVESLNEANSEMGGFFDTLFATDREIHTFWDDYAISTFVNTGFIIAVWTILSHLAWKILGPLFAPLGPWQKYALAGFLAGTFFAIWYVKVVGKQREVTPKYKSRMKEELETRLERAIEADQLETFDPPAVFQEVGARIKADLEQEVRGIAEEAAGQLIEDKLEEIGSPPEGWGELKAEFVFTPNAPNLREEVQFHDLSSQGSAGIIAWRWDFGDGSTSTEQNPTHVYTMPGQYQVQLSVLDSASNEDTVSRAISVGQVLEGEARACQMTHGVLSRMLVGLTRDVPCEERRAIFEQAGWYVDQLSRPEVCAQADYDVLSLLREIEQRLCPSGAGGSW